MAEASCSGGTPFKRLIDHQSRDVSHHQDRLIDRSGAQSHNSFRSAPQAGQAQNGFAAFVDGPSTLPGMPHHHHAAGRLAAHAAALDPAHALSFAPGRAQQFEVQQAPSAERVNWATDFNRFNQQQQQRQPAQNGFSQQPTHMQMNQQAPQYNFHAAFGQPNAGFTPLYGPTNGGFLDPVTAAAQRPAAEAEFDQEMSRWLTSHGDGAGMEDVDAVMDQMARELELNDVKLAEAETSTQEETTATTTEAPLSETSRFTDLETPEIGNLSLASDEVVTTEPPAEAPKSKSDVAEAAERLLESVQHEEGEKWKNSVFLSLMRDFRDGRKDIVDDEIRETPDNETDATTTAK